MDKWGASGTEGPVGPAQGLPPCTSPPAQPSFSSCLPQSLQAHLGIMGKIIGLGLSKGSSPASAHPVPPVSSVSSMGCTVFKASQSI